MTKAVLPTTSDAPDPTIGKAANTKALEKAGTEGKTNDTVKQMKILGEPVKTEDEDKYKVYGPEKA